MKYTIPAVDTCVDYGSDFYRNDLLLCAFRVIYVHTERENKANGGYENDDQ